ncbi:MAG: aminoacyl-tRNA hydrolase [Legionella sp.]
MAIKLIIGLGNPGSAYEHTRHNAGAWFVSALAQHYNCQFKLDKKMQAELTELEIERNTCKLALPITFMNHSGQATRSICQFYRIQAEEILVAHDELDLPVGSIKLKTAGGHGGHNGLRDIINLLGSPNFHRLRIGIGHPGHRDLVHQYVLNKPSLHDKQQMIHAIDRGISVMPLVVSGDLARAMNQLNS